MEKRYTVTWSQTALDELFNIVASPSDVKERIYLDSFNRLSYVLTLTARKIPNGIFEGYWAKLGSYKVNLVLEVNEDLFEVRIDSIKHKRDNIYRKNK